MNKISDNKSTPRILVISSWQYVNIGDIAHTPGLLALLEKYIPEAEVILWAMTLNDEVAALLKKRFPGLQIVTGRIGENGKATTNELQIALERCDFLLHSSGPCLVARNSVDAFIKYYNKPFGVFGITYGGPQEIEALNRAEFVYFRDSLSLEKAKADGVTCPVMDFGPDAAFGTDLYNDEKATDFLKRSGLEDGKFLCCIPRLRYTPYWLIKNLPFDETKNARNLEMKEHDHSPLREAIIEVVRNTDLKVLVCPEDSTQMAVGKEMIIDKLPEDVKDKVVWREDFWITDEALSVYKRSAGLFGNEMHSPIICIGNGIPAIVCRWAEQTTKGIMWRDIGLGQWLFDMDIEEERAKIPQTVLELAKEPEKAKEKVIAAQKCVQNHQKRMCSVLRESLQLS